MRLPRTAGAVLAMTGILYGDKSMRLPRKAQALLAMTLSVCSI